MAGLALGRRAEDGGDVVVALDVGLLREVEIAAVGLQFAGEGGLQVVFGLRPFQVGHVIVLPRELNCDARAPPSTRTRIH